MKPKTLYKIICCILALAMLSCIVISSYADESLHWYIKRNKNAAPSFPVEAEEIKKLGAIYIDDRVDEGNKKIYLTFDAGYENGNIAKILDILKVENITAAFFLLDNIILKNTDLVIRMADEGHLVCNHTKNHKNLSTASEKEIEKDLRALETIYEEKTGREMSKFFRFPKGEYSINALKCVKDLGYTTVFWSFAYDDWDKARQPSAEKAIKKVLDNTHNGAIMLFHPTSDTNVQIFKELTKEWKKQGYTFGSLNEIIEGR